MSRILPCILKCELTNVYLISFLMVFGLTMSSNSLAQPKPESWSDPNLIMGSSFGHLFQIIYKTGHYETLLGLTASTSRSRYGDQLILQYYSQMQFASPLKLISSKRNGNYWTLYYKTTILATEVIVKMNVVVENDTCRLILPTEFNKQRYFLTLWK